VRAGCGGFGWDRLEGGRERGEGRGERVLGVGSWDGVRERGIWVQVIEFQLDTRHR
jgi:hypothetical protein